ncbi:MAG: transglycosylase SLT domain-containing protein, partial [Selenomonadaceae bacterium]|nr:transglycosylase SLT domain-containing protein [Selenomonadaceae bacterium]
PLEMITNPKYADQLQAMKEGVAGFALPTALGIGAGIIRDSKNRTDEQNTDTAPTTETTPKTDEHRGGNIFGVENYDMPLWGDPNVSSLKNGWSEVLPQIGGVLKGMGFDPVITSGGRTQDHQMSINPSAPNSYHIIRDEGGDAVDISLAEGDVSSEQAQKVLDYFKGTGLFNEVLYHDAGSGLHLHLGGLKTDNLSNGTASSEQKTTDKKSSGIDNFMRAIVQQESGGDYDLTNPDSGAAGAFQIMPDNWSAWAQDAGLSADAPMTPENQERVARHKMLEYYSKFGNWRDVAIAWYGGEGAVNYSEDAKNRPQYSNGQEYPSINEYADSVMSRFENFGGEQGGTNPTNVETSPETSTDENSNDALYQRLIADILSEDNKPQFISTGEDDFTKNILATFAAEKRDEASGSELLDLDSMFDSEGNFINSKSNRKKLTELYGDDLAEFGQTQLDERLSELADKNQPLANLSVDDRKLLSGVLTSKLEDAGTKVGGHFLKRLNEGDAETFNKALGSIGSVKQTALPEELSTEISRLRDEIKTLSDSAIQASNKAEFAETSKQIKARKAKIDSIRTLGKDIAKLENDLQAASENLIKANATDNTDKIVNASDKVSTLQSQLDKKQSELQQILSPQVQDATPKTAPPANQQTADFMANLIAEIQTLKSQLTPDLPREQVQPLAQQIKDKTAQLDKINKLNAQIDTLTTQAAEAYQNLQNPEKQDAAIEQLSDATKKIQAAESELAKIISPQIQDATPAPSKKFAPVKAKADEKISTLNQQIDALRLQDETANAAEIERLTDKRYEADKNNDAKAYNAAKRKVDALSKQYKQKSRALDKLINPRETPQKSEKQPETYPTSEEVQAKIDEINARIRELRNSGEAKNSADISKLSRQANAMKSASKKVGQLTVQRDQAELDGNSQVADQLTGKIADWNKKIDKATKRADEVLNPPQKPAPKEKPQPPAKPVNHQTAQTISRLENDIAQLDDKLMSDLPEEQYAAVKAQYDAKRARLEQIKSLNEQIAAAQKQKDEIRTDAKKARESNDEATSADLRQQYQNVNEQQKQAQAELDDLLFEPANDEVAEAVAKLNAEIRELENQIAKSNSRDEKKSLTEKLTAKKNRLKNILDANQKVIATRKKLAITDQNGDSSNYAEAFSANEQAEKELDKYLNPPAPKEKKPAKAKTEKK